MFNEDYIKYDDGDVNAQIATFVHEVLHVLYFHKNSFENFPKNSAGESFMFKDSAGAWKLRGDEIMKQAKSHYGCSTLDGGKKWFNQ